MTQANHLLSTCYKGIQITQCEDGYYVNGLKRSNTLIGVKQAIDAMPTIVKDAIASYEANINDACSDIVDIANQIVNSSR